MSNWIKKTRSRARKKHEESKLDADLDVIGRWLGSHPLQDPPPDEEKKDTRLFAEGYPAFAKRCAACHTYKQTGGGDAKGPDLRYGSHNTMPAFRDLEGPTSALARHEARRVRELLLKQQLVARNIKEDDPQAQDLKTESEAAIRLVPLSDLDRGLIIRWLLHDYRVVFGKE
jgi:mono/diheme cytochrome c family protein